MDRLAVHASQPRRSHAGARHRRVVVDGKGNAAASAQLNIAMPETGDYYVNVHALATNMGTIISCGNLAAPVS